MYVCMYIGLSRAPFSADRGCRSPTRGTTKDVKRSAHPQTPTIRGNVATSFCSALQAASNTTTTAQHQGWRNY